MLVESTFFLFAPFLHEYYITKWRYRKGFVYINRDIILAIYPCCDMITDNKKACKGFGKEIYEDGYVEKII